jgi:hypothetical protein
MLLYPIRNTGTIQQKKIRVLENWFSMSLLQSCSVAFSCNSITVPGFRSGCCLSCKFSFFLLSSRVCTQKMAGALENARRAVASASSEKVKRKNRVLNCVLKFNQ